MSASAWTVASRAVERARRGTATMTSTPDHRRADLRRQDGQVLVVSLAVAGHPLLDDGADQVVMSSSEAVRAAAAWIDGTPLASRAEPLETGVVDVCALPQVRALWARVADAVSAALPDGTRGDEEPVGTGDSEGVYRLAGPHGAHLAITPRTSLTGDLVEVSWRGQLATGAATYGHGSPGAAARAAAAWAGCLDGHPVVTTAGLRARREALGLSQAGLAARLRVGQATLAQWETGARAPRDPASVDAALTALEDQAHTITRQQVDAADQAAPGQPTTLTTYLTDEAALPGAGVPAGVHRVATAHAAAALRTHGRDVVIRYADQARAGA